MNDIIKANKRVFKKAVKCYGERYQISKAMEEMAELTQQLCKYQQAVFDKRDTKDIQINVVDEIADVLIVCESLKVIFERDRNLKQRLNFKIVRLDSRVNIRNENK